MHVNALTLLAAVTFGVTASAAAVPASSPFNVKRELETINLLGSERSGVCWFSVLVDDMGCNGQTNTEGHADQKGTTMTYKDGACNLLCNLPPPPQEPFTSTNVHSNWFGMF